MSDEYGGISYPFGTLLYKFNFFYKLWKKIMCPNGYHLLDEVLSYGTGNKNSNVHYLVCDACNLEIHIKGRIIS